MRILYDSNILVRMLSRREAIIAFKKDLTEKGIVHISSKHILCEVEEVLVEKMKLTKQKAKAAARLLERQSDMVNITAVEKASRDPFDDYILAAACAGKVEYLITNDDDLLILGEHKGIRIVTLDEYEDIRQQQNNS